MPLALISGGRISGSGINELLSRLGEERAFSSKKNSIDAGGEGGKVLHSLYAHRVHFNDIMPANSVFTAWMPRKRFHTWSSNNRLGEKGSLGLTYNKNNAIFL
jgi:hypothetical protein